jgi:DNA-binding NarL/FixJ family response regulator
MQSSEVPFEANPPSQGQLCGNEKTRILLVDDHAIIRAGLARWINEQSPLTVCGEAGSTVEAISQLQRAHPDLVIVDLILRESYGLDLVRYVKREIPPLPVLVLSMHEESVYAARCLAAGAKGYVMKKEEPEKLAEAIRTVLAGGVYVSEHIKRQLLRRVVDIEGNAPTSPLGRLTNRELQVMELLGKGFRNRQVAAQLGLSVRTVEAYGESMKKKLGLNNAAGLAQFAIESRLVNIGLPLT